MGKQRKVKNRKQGKKMYERIKNLNEEEFKRYTGVKRETFEKMAEKMREKERRKKKEGRRTEIKAEDKVLITLEYLREYRTMFHIGVSWGISEAQVSRIIKETEKELIKVEEFHIPGKKKLLERGGEIEVVVVDVGEKEIERPKKNKKNITVERKKDIQ